MSLSFMCHNRQASGLWVLFSLVEGYYIHGRTLLRGAQLQMLFSFNFDFSLGLPFSAPFMPISPT